MDRIEELEDALHIEWAQGDGIRVDDARRLTGPGIGPISKTRFSSKTP